MKIWYQSFSFASPDPSESYPRILRESMLALFDKGTELTFGNMTRSIPSGHHMHVVQTYDIPEMLRNLVLAEQNGYDAVIIGNALDPGLFDARSLLRIPVLSIGQSALLFSQQIGTKALVIASGRKAIPIVRENIRRFGLSAGVQDVISAAGDLSVKQMTSAFDDAELQKTVIDAFKTSILQVLLYHAGVTVFEGRPIVPGYLVTGLMTEMAAKLHKVGLSTSSVGQFAPLDGALRAEVERTWPEWLPARKEGAA
jgi:Asp/Glu/hydantoin racemase